MTFPGSIEPFLGTETYNVITLLAAPERFPTDSHQGHR
jgi:hypothetical protein